MKSILLLLALLPVSVSLCAAAELKHFWDFEGDEWWLDKAGRAHGEAPGENSTINIGDGAGGVGRSMENQGLIRGGDDHLVINSGELYAPGTEAFSFAYWLRMPDDGTSDPRGIFDFSGNGRDGVQSLFIGNTGELAFRIDFPGSGFALAKVPMALEDGEWHSVVATYDPVAGLQVHIDGFGVDGSASAVAGSVSMDSDSYLGSFNFTGQEAFKGLSGNLDDLAIYSGVLTEEEITQLSVREKPDLRIDSVSYAEGVVEITWPAQEDEIFAVWWSTDLQAWAELTDEVPAGPDGGRFEVDLSIMTPGLPQLPERFYLQVRRPE